MTEVALGGGPEFDRIRAIARDLGERAVGLGDDCALIAVGGQMLALSTDASVEGRHFRREWLRLDEIGWRAAAAALSDLAAVGAEPIGLLVATTVPADAGEEELRVVMTGVGDAAAAAGATVLGGDLTVGPGWSLAVTVIGRVARPIRRRGAAPGDGLWVTGALGGARVALDAWEAGEVPPPAARIAFARPVPRIAAGRWLAAHGATSGLDLSDGLAGDVGHLAAASGVEVDVALERVPVASDVVAAARRRDVPVQQYAAEGGEDYELLVTLPGDFGEDGARAFERDCGVALTRIGAVGRGTGVRFRLAGRVLTLRGFDHFA